LWNARRDAEDAVAKHRAEIERAAREADWLRHAVAELQKLAPEAGEETALAERRTTMMQSEKVAGDLREAHDAVAGAASPVPALAAAVRRLERRGTQAPALVEPAVKAIDAALTALDEARGHLEHALASPITIRRSWSGSRSGCSRSAPPAASTIRRSMRSTRWPKNTPAIWP
jgi:DNA repair protein RecN (Recombination protein N)